MGNRAVVIFHVAGKSFSPATYLHWHGSAVPQLLEEAHNVMRGRGGDLSYTVARFIGVCHSRISGNLSLGCFNITAKSIDDLNDHCPGDAGVFAVDISKNTWVVCRLTGSISECSAPTFWQIGEQVNA